MKNNKNYDELFKRAGKKGYLVVPRQLLEAAFDTDHELTMVQAFLYLYMSCEFCDRRGEKALKRGQLIVKAPELAEQFGWSVSRVRRYLHFLEDLRAIDIEQVQGLGVVVTLRYYEVLTGGKGRPVEGVSSPDFYAFWKLYYELLGQDGADYYPAKMLWERMTVKERKLAKERMERYFRSLPDIRFVKSAQNYLRFKAYLMPEDIEELEAEA